MLSKKEELFKKFYEMWGTQFEQIKFILQYLHTYKPVIEKLEIDSLLKPENVIDSQKDWLWLLSKLEGKEKEFFKPFWVPIQETSYDIFIDLSDADLPMIGWSYFHLEPRTYSKVVHFEKTSDLMLATDTDIDFKEFKKTRIDKMLEPLAEAILHNERLAFAGAIQVEPVTYQDVFKESKSNIELNFFDNNNCLVECMHVKPFILSLFPYDLKISIHKFHLGGSLPKDFKQIKCIRDLTYLIKSRGWGLVFSFYISFIDSEGSYMEFDNNNFSFLHYDKCVVDNFISAYNALIPLVGSSF